MEAEKVVEFQQLRSVDQLKTENFDNLLDFTLSNFIGC